MDKDILSTSQKLAYEQQVELLAHAHTQALKFLIESHHPHKLTVKSCLSYFELAKAKLSETEFKEFLSLMKHCKEPNLDILDVLAKIDCLFQGHPELIQGFGMFLPPDLNLQMQTGSLSFLNALKKEKNSSTEKLEVEKPNQDSALKENMTEPAADVVAGPSHDDIASYSLDKKDSNFSKGVDDDYALTFLSKVKERFQDELQVFNRFLALLDSVRKDCLGDRNDIETEVFLEVCNLFQTHIDLIEEFKMFVPNASFEPHEQALNDMSDQPSENTSDENQQSTSDAVDMPKYSYVNDPSIAPVYKFGSYEEHVFFDKVREAFGHREVFDNFLRCLMLYNEDVITRSELLKLATSFLGKFPHLLRQFKDMLRFNESGENIEIIPMRIITLENQRQQPEIGLDIDFSTGGRNGASYRALPKDFEQPKCSGRTPLCKEVLNDTWVSFPSWSEDSTFVTSCKTQYEEIIYRCEDERFELDMAITANAYTTQVLENIQKRINKMSAEEKSVFYLDDMLGGSSTVIHQKTLHRLYGDKTDELVEGLKRNPVVAVPIILKRLKVKEDEWKEKQIKFNEIWRTQIDHYYLKSLDHQGINFKQNDSKSFRPKSILNEMEMVYAEKKENKAFNSAHFLLEFKEMDVFQDAINLMLQYLKKLPGVYRDDRRRIELLVRSFIPDFFAAPRSTLIEEDMEAEEESREADEPMEVENEGEERSGQTSPTGSNRDDGSSDQDESNSNEENELSDEADKAFIEESDVFDKIDPLPLTNLPYTLFFASTTWYIFFRQFHILCERLSRLLLESNRQDIPIKKEEDTEQDSKMPEQKYKPSYQELIEKLSLLLSGGMDYAQFEEESRSLFGIHAFISFTMDKLVLNVVRQLQQVVTDDICKQSTALFIHHTKTISSVGFTSPVEASQIEYEYLRRVEKIMEDEKCFKIVWHKKDHTLTVHLIEQENEDDIPDPCDAEKWSDYLDAYVTDDSCSEDGFPDWSPLPVFLPRNLRKQMAYWKNKVAYVEKLWKTRQSSKFIKRNIAMTAKKRKALSLITPLLNKMSRRSSIQEGSVHSSCSRAGSVDGSECPADDNLVIPDEPTSDAVDDAKDLDENSAEVKIVQTNEEDSEKAELVLVDLSEDEMGVQEESVHDTDHVVEIKSGDISLESSELELDVKNETPDAGSAYLDTIKEESMEVEDSSCNSVVSGEKKDNCKEATNSCEGEVSEEKEVEETFSFQDIGAEMDLTSRIDMAVETASRVIETIAVDDSKEDEAAISGPDEDKQDGTDTPNPGKNSLEIRPVLPRRKIVRKPCDYAIRTRKNRTNQSYVKRRIRVKRGGLKGAQCNKGKRKRPIKLKSELYDDPTFDYALFSEMPEEEKIPYIAFSYLVAADNIEVSFRQGSCKVCFVHNCDLFLYRRFTLIVSKEQIQCQEFLPGNCVKIYNIHQAVSEIKSSNFNAWHRIWLDRYVTPGMQKSCNDWLLKSDQEKFKLVRINVSDCTKPPYIPYNKYKIRYFKTDLIEN